jgi:hypothetical protein
LQQNLAHVSVYEMCESKANNDFMMFKHNTNIVVHGVVSKVDVVHWRYDFQCADLSSSKNIAEKSLQCSKSILCK